MTKTKEEVVQEFDDAIMKVVIKMTKELNDISKATTRYIKIGDEDVEIDNTLLSDNKEDKLFERTMVVINNRDKIASALGIIKPEPPKKSKDGAAEETVKI